VAQRRRRPFAPLWVYFFGLFALAVTQRLLFPPDEHSVTFNVLFYACGAAGVIAVLTVLERVTR
jgi:hypothetical protein